jgi:mitochondrial fission protein ELM1
MTLIRVLTDDRAGHNAHSLGIAGALQRATGGVVQEMRLSYSPLAALPGNVAGIYGLSADSRDRLRHGPAPDIVIATGRRMSPVLKRMKQLWPACKTVHGFGHPSSFTNASLMPEHDEASGLSLRFRGALHALNDTLLADAAEGFNARFTDLPAPRIGVLTGGNRKKHKARKADIHHLYDLAELLHGGKGSLIITTSRRTPSFARKLAEERITCPFFFYDGDGENPYRQMLAGCDALVVSGDSISMMSEACYTGKPVFIDLRFSTMSAKHRRVAQQLIDDGFAAPLNGDSRLSFTPAARLDEMTRLLPELCSRLDIRR